MSTFRLYFRALFGTFFLNMVFHCIFLGKKAIIITSHPNAAQGSFFPLESYSKKT